MKQKTTEAGKLPFVQQVDLLSSDLDDDPRVIIEDGVLKSAAPFSTEREARNAAKEFLGKKAEEGISFVLRESTLGQWDWLNMNSRAARKMPQTHVKALIARVFVRCTSEDVDRVVSRVMAVHPKADAADEPFEYQMRGVGCIGDATALTPEFSTASGMTVRAIREMLSEALSADGISAWPDGTATAMKIGCASENEYAFDCTLTAAFRVKAKSREDAESIVRDVLNAADCNGGAWPNGDPVLFEASLNDSKLELFEVNGEQVDDTAKLLY